MEVLQTSALPLGDGAGRNRIVREGIPAAARSGDNSVSFGGSQKPSSIRTQAAESAAPYTIAYGGRSADVAKCTGAAKGPDFQALGARSGAGVEAPA